MYAEILKEALDLNFSILRVFYCISLPSFFPSPSFPIPLILLFLYGINCLELYVSSRKILLNWENQFHIARLSKVDRSK